jgi:hypothetical protein
MEPERSLQCLQETNTGSIYACLPSGVFPSVFPTKILYSFPICSMLAKWNIRQCIIKVIGEKQLYEFSSYRTDGLGKYILLNSNDRIKLSFPKEDTLEASEISW